MEQKTEKDNKKTAHPDDAVSTYIGNVWGWKFSWISLAIILFFFAFIAGRYWYLGIEFDPAQLNIPEDEQQFIKKNEDRDTLK